VKLPRFTLASIVFLVLILAIDFGIIRAAFRSLRFEDWSITALWLLPMIDALLIGLYRLRRRERRTGRALGFLVAGSAATAATFVSSCVAPEAFLGMLRAVGRPIFEATSNGLTRWMGNAAMQTTAVQLLLGISFELLVPIAFFCGPALVAALLGGWLAGRVPHPWFDRTKPLHETLAS